MVMNSGERRLLIQSILGWEGAHRAEYGYGYGIGERDPALDEGLEWLRNNAPEFLPESANLPVVRH